MEETVVDKIQKKLHQVITHNILLIIGILEKKSKYLGSTSCDQRNMKCLGSVFDNRCTPKIMLYGLSVDLQKIKMLAGSILICSSVKMDVKYNLVQIWFDMILYVHHNCMIGIEIRKVMNILTGPKGYPPHHYNGPTLGQYTYNCKKVVQILLNVSRMVVNFKIIVDHKLFYNNKLL